MACTSMPSTVSSIAIFHDRASRHPVGADRGKHYHRIGSSNALQGGLVEMIGMIVGEENQVGLGQLRVIGHLAVGIDMDDFSAKGHHQ